MDNAFIALLLEDLKSEDALTRDQATQELWRIWFEQKGAIGLEMIRRAQMMLELGDTNGAEATLNELLAAQPDFAEAWNRRAVLYYMQGRYEDAIADCEQVLALNPVHFGALHGLGLCHASLHNYREAIRAFRHSLQIQPHSLTNQRLILECTARLS